MADNYYDEMMSLFQQARRRAVDIPLAHYREDKESINRVARAWGYRFAGERLGRAVFTTKPAKEMKACQP